MIKRSTWIIWIVFLSLYAAEFYFLYYPINQIFTNIILVSIPFSICICSFGTFISIKNNDIIIQKSEDRPLLPTIINSEDTRRLNVRDYMINSPVAGIE